MYTVLVSFICLLAIILVGAVLIQPGKADMASGMTGIGGQLGSMFGSRRTADTLTKVTIGIAASILLLSIVTNKFFLVASEEERNAATVGAPMPTEAPVQQTPAQQAPAQQAPAPQGK